MVGAGKAPSLQLPGCSPCELCSAPSFPPHRSSRAEGRKGEFGGEGQDSISHPPSKFRLPPAPWLSWNSLSRGTGPNPKNQMTPPPSQCPSLMGGVTHTCGWRHCSHPDQGMHPGLPAGLTPSPAPQGPHPAWAPWPCLRVPQQQDPKAGSAHVPLLVRNCPHPWGFPPELTLSH